MVAGCEFTEGAKGGECTGTPGVLSAAEINKIIDNGATVSHEHAFPNPDIASSCFLFGVAEANAAATAPFAMTSSIILFASAN